MNGNGLIGNFEIRLKMERCVRVRASRNASSECEVQSTYKTNHPVRESSLNSMLDVNAVVHLRKNTQILKEGFSLPGHVNAHEDRLESNEPHYNPF